MNASLSVFDHVGETPMLRLTRFDTGRCELFLKLEDRNPGGSIKHRIGLAMIEAAESAGRIHPGDTLVAATTGNTGVALSMAAAHKGYSLMLVVPEGTNRDRMLHLKALGAVVHLARSDVEPEHTDHYRGVARRLARELPRGFCMDQHSDPENPRAHEKSTAREVWRQMEQRLDAFVCGVGSGGTLTGCGRFLKQVNPGTEIVLADPEGSVLAAAAGGGAGVDAPRPSLVEGVGGRSVPDNFDPALVDRAYTISDAESFSAARELLRREGVLGGASTGLMLAAALRYCREQREPKRVVSLVCDTGHAYLPTVYDPAWLLEHGLVSRPRCGDLRDLISRRADEGEVVSVAPADTLLTAYTRLRMFDVSQLPVLESGRIVGMIDESDLLLAVYDNREYFDYPVRDFMITRLEIVKPTASVASLLPVFRGDHVAIIADGDTFYGLITQVDLINHLRNSMHNDA